MMFTPVLGLVKGGVEGPTDPAVAVPLFLAARNAGPLFIAAPPLSCVRSGLVNVAHAQDEGYRRSCRITSQTPVPPLLVHIGTISPLSGTLLCNLWNSSLSGKLFSLNLQSSGSLKNSSLLSQSVMSETGLSGTLYSCVFKLFLS